MFDFMKTNKLKLEVGRVANLSQLMLLLLAKAEEYEGSILFLIIYSQFLHFWLTDASLSNESHVCSSIRISIRQQ